MNWEALGAIAELLGAIGVIATLLYLSRQIENNSKQLEGAATIAVHTYERSLIEGLYENPQLWEIVKKGNADWDSLTPEEQSYAGLCMVCRSVAKYIFGVFHPILNGVFSPGIILTFTMPNMFHPILNGVFNI